MKNTIKIIRFSILLISLFTVKWSYSQPLTFSNPANGDVGYTTSTITGIGVGPFTGNISAALHVNTNLLPSQTGGGAFTADKVFRTEVPASTDQVWEMYTNGTKKFHILNSNTNDVSLGTIAGGNLTLFTNGTGNPRLTVVSGGNVGIGTTSPSNLFQVHGGIGQWTNSTTGSTGSDGFLININSSTAELNQQESSPLKLLTAGADRMTILGSGNTGYIGMGTTSPSSVLHIDGNGTPTPTGEVFRTDGKSTDTQFWRMYRGGTLSAQLSSNTSDNTVLNALVGNLSLNSAQTGTNSFVGLSINSQTKLRVINNGNIGIGPGFGDPKSLVHLDLASTNDVYQQFTNEGTTGSSNSSQGFKIGIEGSTGKAIINQQENAAMNFLTNATQRMTILSSGEVGIGTSSPASLFQVHSGDEQLTNSTTGATSSDGFLLKLNSGTVELKQQENDDMKFYTNNTQQAVIKAGGNVGINESSPSAKLQVKGTSTSNNNLGFLITDSGGNDYVQARDGGSVLVGNGLSSTAGGLGIGVNLPTTLYSRLQINGAGGAYGRCIEVDDYTGSYPIFYVYDNTTVGIGTNTPSYPLDVQAGTGTVARFSGDILCNSTTYPSDGMFKTNVTNVTGAGTIINQLTPRQYEYDSASYPQMHFRTGNQFGFLAQELEQVLPELVGIANSPEIKDMQGNIIDSSFEFKTVNYVGLIPLLVGALQEQQQNMNALRAQLTTLQNSIPNGNRMMNPDQENRTTIAVELNNSKSIILDQNVPNPFADQTTISYTIPDDVSKAQIIFYNNNGSVLRIIDVNEKGKGELNVFAPDLSRGIYTYTLIADGKVIETKKMVKQ